MKKLVGLLVFFFGVMNGNAQDFVVAPTVFNILYFGVDNPVKVLVENYECVDIIVSTTNGNCRGQGCEYIIRPDHIGEANIQVEVLDGKDTILIGSMPFRVRYTPDPSPTVAKNNGGTLVKKVLLQQLGIEAKLIDFELEVRFWVKSYTVSVLRGEEVVYQADVQGNKFNNELKSAIQAANASNILQFKNIVAEGEDGTTRELGGLEFVIR